MIRALRMNTGRLYVDVVMVTQSAGTIYAVFSAPGKFDPHTIGKRAEAMEHLRRLQAQAAPVATPPPVQAPPTPVVVPPRPVVAPALRVEAPASSATSSSPAGGLPPLEDMMDTNKSARYWKQFAASKLPSLYMDAEEINERIRRASGYPFERAHRGVRDYLGDNMLEAEMSGDSETEASLRRADYAMGTHFKECMESPQGREYEKAVITGQNAAREVSAAAAREAQQRREAAEREAALRPLNAAVAELATLRREVDVRRRQWEEGNERGVPMPGGDKAFAEKSNAMQQRIYQLENSILSMQHELRRAGFIQ